MVSVTNKGIEKASKLYNGVVSTPFTFLANGSGSTAEDDDDNALVTENTANGFGRASATCTNEGNTTSVWNKVWTCVTAAVTVREVGVFDEDGTPAGDCGIRHVYASNKVIDVSESLEVTLKLAFTRPA